MHDTESPEFTIVGSGLAGALMACFLGRAGRRVDLYEKRPDPRQQGQDRGRSINLAISVRGIHALKEVGLDDLVLAQVIPMRGRMIHSPTGQLTVQPYGKDDSQAINSVSRAGLNLALIQAAAKYDSVRFFFDHKCTGIDLTTTTLDFRSAGAHETAQVPANRVIAADGAYSAIRWQMQKQDGFNLQQDYLTHGYKELTIPAGAGGRFQLEKHALHIWPRHSFMMIALPNIDGSFTCTLFLPYQGDCSFAQLDTDTDIQRFFQEQFPDAVSLMPTLLEDFRVNPTGPLVTIRCQPWHVADRVVLIGDACHAVVPFLGQGMNAAFEDCVVLNQCLEQYAPDCGQAFRAFEHERKTNVDTLADLCVANFLEMRDLVSSRWFLLKKKLQIFMHKLLPGWYIPLYTLVSFSRTPYAEARRRARRQDRIVLTFAVTMLAIFLVAVLWLMNR